MDNDMKKRLEGIAEKALAAAEAAVDAGRLGEAHHALRVLEQAQSISRLERPCPQYGPPVG